MTASEKTQLAALQTKLDHGNRLTGEWIASSRVFVVKELQGTGFWAHEEIIGHGHTVEEAVKHVLIGEDIE